MPLTGVSLTELNVWIFHCFKIGNKHFLCMWSKLCISRFVFIIIRRVYCSIWIYIINIIYNRFWNIFFVCSCYYPGGLSIKYTIFFVNLCIYLLLDSLNSFGFRPSKLSKTVTEYTHIGFISNSKALVSSIEEVSQNHRFR